MLSIVLLLALAATGTGSSELGALEIHTLPGAEVLWEGISLGTTDAEGVLLIERIPSGRYGVGLRKEGFRERAVEVEVEAGLKTRLSLALQKLSPPKPVPESAPPQREPPARRPEPPPTPVERPTPEAPRATVTESPPRAPAPAAVETAIGQPPPAPEAGEVTETDPAEGGEGANAPKRGRVPVASSLLVAVALAGALGLFLARRRHQPVPLKQVGSRRAPAPPDVKTISQSEDDTGFIETLRRQEQDLDDSEPGGWRREPEIIDAEFIEVLETNEE